MYKKRIILIISFGVGIVVILLIIFLMFMIIIGKNAKMEEMQIQVEDLNWQLDVYGDIVEVYTVIATKKSGEVFDQTDVDVMAIPSAQVSDQFVMDISELKNCIYKIDVEPGTPLTKGLFFKEVLTQTDRYVDIVADLFPIGAREGDYYDLRLVTPNGLDYIVLSKKRVVGFYDSAVRFILNEEEIHQYQSSLVDTFINPGTYIYATTYVEPSMQKRASVYYPVSDLVRAVMEIDPNIVQLAETDLIAKRREAFEHGLEIDEDLSSSIVAGRSEQVARLVEAAKSKIGAAPVTDEQSETESEATGNTSTDSSSTGNLMSPSLTEEKDELSDMQNNSEGKNNISPAEQKTNEQMQFNSNPEIVPSGLQDEIKKTGEDW